MVNFSLKDRVALITGASRGIGEAIAETLSRYGAYCILVSRKIENLQRVADSIEEAGGKAEAVACNVGDSDQIQALFQELDDRFGKLDILVNNAAANPFFGNMIDADEGVWDKIMDVNLKGPFLMIRHGARLMADAGGGSIVNISSVNGVRPGLMQGIYSISKAGVISMTRAFAKELAGQRIRVNAVLPGLTDTRFAKALIHNKEIHEQAIRQIPLGRHAEPEEMAGAVLYLASDASSYTTGACLTCDGGMLA